MERRRDGGEPLVHGAIFRDEASDHVCKEWLRSVRQRRRRCARELLSASARNAQSKDIIEGEMEMNF